MTSKGGRDSEIESRPYVSGSFGSVAETNGEADRPDERAQVVSDCASEHMESQQFIAVEAVFEKMHPVVRTDCHIEHSAYVVFAAYALPCLETCHDKGASCHFRIVDAVKRDLLVEVFSTFLSSKGVHFSNGVFRGQIASLDAWCECEAGVERE